MKTNKWITGMAICAGIGLAACTSDDGLSTPTAIEVGQLTLSLSSGTKFTEETRAVNENSYKNTGNYTVVITDKNGNQKLDCKGSEVASKMPLTLSIKETYTVKAFYGKEHDASRDEFYVEDVASVNVSPEQDTKITLNCTPTCGRIKVNFRSDMSSYFSDYKVEFTGTNALGRESITWLKNDTEPWYVKLNEEEEEISFTITTVVNDQYNGGGAQSGTFKLKRNAAYRMDVNPSYVEPGTGNIGLDITINEETIDKPVDIEVPVTWIQ